MCIRDRNLINGNFFEIVHELDEYIGEQDHLYVTICMDCFTSSYAPGVSAPQALGIDPEKVILLLKHVFSTGKPTSFDICEVSPRFDHAPGARSNISPRFDRTPGAGRIFGKYSIHVYPVAPRSQSVHSLPILHPHERDTLLPFLHTNGLLRFSGQI